MKALWFIFLKIVAIKKMALFRAGLLALLVLVMGAALLGLSGWFITASAMAGLAGAGSQFDVFRPSAMVRFLALGRTFARYGERLMTHDATLRSLEVLRLRVLVAHLRAPYQRLVQVRGSQALNRLTTDIDALDGLTLRLALPLAAAVSSQLIGLAALWVLVSAKVGIWVFFIYVLGAVLLGVGLQRLAVRASFRYGGSVRSVRSRLIDLVQSRRDLAVYGQLQHQAQFIRSADDRRNQLRTKLDLFDRLAGAGLAALTSLAVGGALVLGGMDASQHRLSPANVALGVFVALALTEGLMPLRRSIIDVGRMFEAARRLKPLLEPNFALEQSQPRSPAVQKTSALLALQGVSLFRPGTSRPLNSPVTVTVSRSETMALVGPSGCGKTSFLLAIAKLYPLASGIILVDGVPLSQIDEVALRRKVTLVPQRSVLMGDSVGEELRLACPACSDHDIWQALEAVQIATLIRSRGGLDVVTGPMGQAFSGGEARRLVLARAILRQPDVLLLDEPTEGIDHDVAALVLQGIRYYLPQAAIIIAAHRSIEKTFAQRDIPINNLISTI